MKFHGRFYKRFGHIIDTPEVLKFILRRIGIELTAEESENMFQQLRLQDKSSEFAEAAPKAIDEAELNDLNENTIAENELENVAGGCGGSSLDPDDLNGRRVTMVGGGWVGCQGTILDGQIVTICSEKTVEYLIKLDNGQELWYGRQYFHVDS